MKKYYCLLIMFFFSCCVAGQNTNQYRWGAKPPILEACDQYGTPIKGALVPMAPYAYFWITNKKDDNTVIATLGLWADIDQNGNVTVSDTDKFKNLNLNNTARGEILANRISSFSKEYIANNRQYFLVPVSALGTGAIPVYATGKQSQQFTIGAATLPFKLRLHNFDFAKDLNIGSVIGINRRTHATKNNYVNYLFNISISVNDIDNLSARNVSADQLPAKNIAALTLAGGMVWQFGKGQVGLFYGFDFMSHNNWTKYRWVFNKRPWVGIGFGINLFQREDLNAGPGDEISNYKKKKKRTQESTTPTAEEKNYKKGE